MGLMISSGCLDFLDEESANQAPTSIAKFVGERTSFEPDEIITFTGKNSNDPDGDTLEFYWDFDNKDGNDENVRGDISNNGKITHSYNAEGTYTVTLTVTDGKDTDSSTVKVNVEKENSEIRAIVTTDDEVNSEVSNNEIKYTFSAADSISESPITKYEWDFSYESSDGFQAEEESNEAEITHDFDSGIYTIKVRITNEMGESDEASYSDDIELKINYKYTDTRNIDSGNQEHLLQVYGIPARYIRATLEYESNSVHSKDLDLYIYNHSQERNPDDSDTEYVAVNDTHDNDNIEQVNFIELDYYNSTDRAWFDEIHELGEWGVVVDHERTGSNEYTVKIEVIYWE